MDERPDMRPVYLLLGALLVLVAACQEPIHHGLEEREANEMVVTLEQHGIEAGKQVDPAGEAVWMVTVPSGQVVEAWRVLQARGLPRPKVEGFDAFYPSGGLVPTANEERVILQYATAQELRQSLLKVDGVVDAHINLVLPDKPRVQLDSTVIEPPRASVLVKLEAGLDDEPIDEPAVRKLVSGGVEGLDPESVSVIFTHAARSAEPLAEPALATVGPVSVAPRSKGMLQGLIIGMSVCIIVLAAAIVFAVWRLRRRRVGEDSA